MLFNSLEYLTLLALSTLLYWLARSQESRNAILLVGSLIFYASWSVPYLGLLLAVLFLNWFIALRLSPSRPYLLTTALVASLGVLAYYKYANFLLENLGAVLRVFGEGSPRTSVSVLLPLGISFYVFQIIAYTIDVYRGDIEPEEKFSVVVLFTLFFPQLIAGPICRASELIPQLKTKQTFRLADLVDGSFMLLAGFVLKSCFADGLAPYVDVIFRSPEGYSGLDNLLGTAAFGVQILCDFWGYSTMAVGSARLFGLRVPFNFNLPYDALSIRDFWKRWHITLSRWLKDYLFIPLGGSRTSSRPKLYRNLLITMLLGGLWHGANWTFVVWGAIHGGALMVNRAFGERRPRLELPKSLCWLLTMAAVFLGWVFFRAPSVDQAWRQLGLIVLPSRHWWRTALDLRFFELLALFVPAHRLIHRYSYERPISQEGSAAYCLVPALVVFSIVYFVRGSDFIYFQF
ncbi:MAG: MBOAT family protein [Elusimicrobia bacterium]|nr:MBOAT family protein [Elusimicrobiota bacterium]